MTSKNGQPGTVPPGGHVRAYRAEMGEPVFASPELWYLWSWCKFRASHETKTISVRTGKGATLVELLPGQFVFGRKTASEELGWPGKTIENRLKRLEDLGKVARQPASHYTIVTVCNYGLYNGRLVGDGPPTGQPLANHWPGNGQAPGHKEIRDNQESVESQKDDHLCSWNKKLVPASQLKDWCAETFTRPRDGKGPLLTGEHLTAHPDTRRLLLQVGVLRLCGAISEACVQDGCEALRHAARWPDNPGGYLRTIWSKTKYAPDGSGPAWLTEMLAGVELPAGI